MITKLRTVVLTLCLVVLMASMAVSVLGTEVVFTRKYVDSNTYSNVAAGFTETDSETATVYVSNIYKANGDPSDYTRVWAKAAYDGQARRVTINTYTTLTIPDSNRGSSRYLILYMMGNDPSLDCQVSGYWIIH